MVRLRGLAFMWSVEVASSSGRADLVSIVVPAYNEARRIESSLREIDAYLVRQGYASEIVVVDDGSSDGTAELVCALAAGFSVPLRLTRYRANRGKGFALKVGFEAARGDRILFTDADLSTPIEEAARLLACLEGGADIAIGTRKSPGAEISVHQPWLRERLGMVFTLIVQTLVADVSDVTCGFKAFRGDVGRDVFSRLRVYDWSFDAELLWVARQRAYRVEEVPVRWADRPGTKVNLVRDVVGSLVGIARICLYSALGRYVDPNAIDARLEEWESERPAQIPKSG